METNLILNTDSYKLSMRDQYPAGTTNVYSYIEARKPADSSVIFFGLQGFISEYLMNPITMLDVLEAQSILSQHGLPFNREDWEDIVRNHEGYMPVRIKALPEGSRVNTGIPLVTIENTDPKHYWLTTHLETAMLRSVWYASTVATKSNNIRQLIKQYLDLSGDVMGLDFKLHDFGARGVSSAESASIGGAAHLVNFNGTDTLNGILWANRHYKAYNNGIPGFSIPAAEHSTITSWGRDSEKEAYENMIDKFSGAGKMYAVVSDSYDIYNAVSHIWGEELREKVIASGGTLVIRPDSGNPVEVVMTVVEMLGEKFGYTVNDKGYKVLNHVRVIQGDGININIITNILASLVGRNWSADNVAFGMGGELLQHVGRDDFSFAMKCSSVVVNGEQRDVVKDPVTDKNKKSKAGRFSVVKNDTNNKHRVVPEIGNSWSDVPDLLDVVYEWSDEIAVTRSEPDGDLPTTFELIRQRARNS